MMDTLVHADIFFLITSVSVVILTILAIIAAILLFRILATVRYVADKWKIETDLLSADIAELRAKVATNKWKMLGVAGILYRFFRRHYK